MERQSDAMPRPQPREMLAMPARAAVLLLVMACPGAEDDVCGARVGVAGYKRADGFRLPEDGLRCLAGIGSGLWGRLYGIPRPAGLHLFRDLRGAAHTTVATLLFHLRTRNLDLCFELARQLMIRLADSADVVGEVNGFRYFDERDLLGFVDGTESPPMGAEAAVRIGGEDPALAGGSYVIAQEYLHDLKAWTVLTAESSIVLGASECRA